MNNLLLNWRFGAWHLQVSTDFPFLAFRKNQYWIEHKPEKWFERY